MFVVGALQAQRRLPGATRDKVVVFDQLILQALLFLSKEFCVSMGSLAKDFGALIPVPDVVVVVQAPYAVVNERRSARGDWPSGSGPSEGDHGSQCYTARAARNFREMLDTRRAARYLIEANKDELAVLILDGRRSVLPNTLALLDSPPLSELRCPPQENTK